MKHFQIRKILFAVLACAGFATASAQNAPAAAPAPSTLNVAVGGVISREAAPRPPARSPST